LVMASFFLAYEFIDLRFQNLEELPSWLAEKTQVKKLYLNGNNLKTIDPGVLKKLENLEVLLLNNNFIGDVKWINALPISLKEISINNNALPVVQFEKVIKETRPDLLLV